jgi:nicotinate-nucleotide adenylyltransferase
MPEHPQRLGFLGGSFDPPHLGHLILAQDAMEACRLDRVEFVPAARNPLKTRPPRVADAHRLGMLQAAVGDNPRFGICDWELSHPPPSYTLGTVRELRRRHPQAEIRWIIGGDQLPMLPKWHRVDELAAAIAFIVVHRPGETAEPPPGMPAALRLRHVACHLIGISSTEIRARLRAGKPVDFFLHPGVLRYIRKHNLYAPQPSET